MSIPKIGSLFLIVLLAAAVILLVLFLIILFNSPGKPEPVTDETGEIPENSLSEKGYLEIGGQKLGFYIKSRNLENPVLLYLHGGMPDYFLTQKYPTRLEELFTVVWWDQRGAGLSRSAGDSDEPVTMDRLIEDTRAITEYLQTRFSRQKIWLMAHSGGTYLGIKVLEKYPELYSGYLGVAQITWQSRSEKLAYDYILEQYRKDPSKKGMVNILKAHPVAAGEPLPPEYLRIRDRAMHDLGVGTMRNMKDVLSGIFVPSLLFREYSLADKVNLWRGKADSGISIMWNQMVLHDLARENRKFDIPVYFFHGVHDYTCSYSLAGEYFDRIEAPVKGFYSFENSAHSPIFEEPDKCIRILREEILNRE